MFKKLMIILGVITTIITLTRAKQIKADTDLKKYNQAENYAFNKDDYINQFYSENEVIGRNYINNSNIQVDITADYVSYSTLHKNKIENNAAYKFVVFKKRSEVNIELEVQYFGNDGNLLKTSKPNFLNYPFNDFTDATIEAFDTSYISFTFYDHDFKQSIDETFMLYKNKEGSGTPAWEEFKKYEQIYHIADTEIKEYVHDILDFYEIEFVNDYDGAKADYTIVNDDYTANFDIAGEHDVLVEYTYQSKKALLNLTIKTIDINAPFIEAPTSIEKSYRDSLTLEQILEQVYISDPNELSFNIEIESNYKPNKVGTYEITITATNSFNKSSKHTIEVKVVDNMPLLFYYNNSTITIDKFSNMTFNDMLDFLNNKGKISNVYRLGFMVLKDYQKEKVGTQEVQIRVNATDDIITFNVEILQHFKIKRHYTNLEKFRRYWTSRPKAISNWCNEELRKGKLWRQRQWNEFISWGKGLNPFRGDK